MQLVFGKNIILTYRIFAWSVLSLTILVIISGDIVQITGSGAGCGESWPKCNDELLPDVTSTNTIIEFSHRLLTTIVGFCIISLALFARFLFGKNHFCTKVTYIAIFFLITEILIGAMLVRFGWVEFDISWGRVIADALHVLNTFFLIAAIASSTQYKNYTYIPNLEKNTQRLVFVIMIFLIIAVTGALNSLADLLYVEKISLSQQNNIYDLLIGVRALHPFIAIIGGIIIAYIMLTFSNQALPNVQKKLIIIILASIGLQFIVGIINIVLMTPLTIQIIHLVLANILWISTVIFTVNRITNQCGHYNHQ
tara:strand:- start:10232 stop:11161 length:930 start_codon:yes stop_codon:yes gene_type:complete